MKDSVTIKLRVMADISKRQNPGQDRNDKESLSETTRQHVSDQSGSGDLSGSSRLDEKSSGMGRRDKGTGLATKDGLTGSDYDGQLSD